MNAEERVSKGWGLSCPDCGHVLPRNYVLSGRLMTGRPCPECGVTLYRQYVESRFALTKRAAFMVWPAYIGLLAFLLYSMERLMQTVSPWILVGIPFLAFAAFIVAPIAIPYFRRKQLKLFILSTDVGGWSLSKRRLFISYGVVLVGMIMLCAMASSRVLPEISVSTEYVLWFLAILPGAVMMIVGYPYAHTQTPKSDVPQEVPKDDGWIAVD